MEQTSNSWAEVTVYGSGYADRLTFNGEEADAVLHRVEDGGIPIVIGHSD